MAANTVNVYSVGVQGPTGATGADGTSGTSGTSGVAGTSGTSGTNGTSGSSGSSGTSGNGTSGSSGSSGTSGINGSSGTSGTSGAAFPFTGSAEILGSLEVSNSITGSFFTGSFVGDGSGLTGLSKEYALWSHSGNITNVTNGDIIGSWATPETSSAYNITFDSFLNVWENFTSGKTYEMQYTYCMEDSFGNNVILGISFDFLAGSKGIRKNGRVETNTSGSFILSQPTAIVSFTSNGTEQVRLVCDSSQNSPNILTSYTFLTIKEI